MSRRFIQQPTTTWTPKTKNPTTTVTNTNKQTISEPIIQPTTSRSFSSPKPVVVKEEVKETPKLFQNTPKTISMDNVSNKLIGAFKDIMDNLTILCNKTIELEQKNEKLQKKIDSNHHSDNNYNEILEKLNALEKQNREQQKLIDHLNIQIEGTKNKSTVEKNDRNETIKQDEERVKQMMNEMKYSQQEMSKKEMELRKRKEEADKYVEDQKTNSFMNRQMNEIKDKCGNYGHFRPTAFCRPFSSMKGFRSRTRP